MQYRFTKRENGVDHVSVRFDVDDFLRLRPSIEAEGPSSKYLAMAYLCATPKEGKGPLLRVALVAPEHEENEYLYQWLSPDKTKENAAKFEKSGVLIKNQKTSIDLLITKRVIDELRNVGKLVTRISSPSVRLQSPNYSSLTSEWPIVQAA